MGLDPASVLGATATVVVILNGVGLLLLKAGDRRDARQLAADDAEQASVLAALRRPPVGPAGSGTRATRLVHAEGHSSS